VSIPHLKVFEIENGYPKYWISACVEAICTSGIGIIASSLLLFATNQLPKHSSGILHLRNRFGETKLPKSIQTYPTKIECMQTPLQ
jgi:hypothetical protein